MRVDPRQDRDDLNAALRDFEAGTISLSQMRGVAETIVDRWRDAAAERPPFDETENGLWNVVWEFMTGCRESLGPGRIALLRGMLEDEVELPRGGPQLRP